MATNIPPHNLGEVIDALELVLKRPEATLDEVLARMPGPDFPTGGRLLSGPDDLRRIYERGEGPLELRGEWTLEGQAVILTSVPYGVAKADLVEEIGALVGADKVPQIADVRDESTDIVRVVLELKKGASRGCGDGVPLQAHAPADAHPRQPDVPRADRARGRVRAAARRSDDDPARVSDLPPRRRHAPPRARSQVAPRAHPHPGGLGDDLPRARRVHQDHPRHRRTGPTPRSA